MVKSDTDCDGASGSETSAETARIKNRIPDPHTDGELFDKCQNMALTDTGTMIRRATVLHTAKICHFNISSCVMKAGKPLEGSTPPTNEKTLQKTAKVSLMCFRPLLF